jgi:membrane protein YqaA with SNARE-associated domain
MPDEAKRQPRNGWLRKIYAWMMENAKGRHAWAALAGFAFAEASFFPVPPDLMLLPMMLADRRRSFLIAGWATLWSVIGGAFGYAIGALFWDTAGIWLIHFFHVPMSEVDALRLKYTEHAYLIIVQGLTPIPYKLVTITSGLAAVPFHMFMLYSAITRGLRFIVLEGILVYFFGEQARIFLERYMELIMIVVLVLVILGVVLVRYLA